MTGGGAGSGTGGMYYGAQAHVTLTVSSLSAGPHTITALYSGDAGFAGAGATTTQTVGPCSNSSSPAPTWLSLSSDSPYLAAPGQAVTLTATVGGYPDAPASQVTVLDGAAVAGTTVVDMSFQHPIGADFPTLHANGSITGLGRPGRSPVR